MFQVKSSVPVDKYKYILEHLRETLVGDCKYAAILCLIANEGFIALNYC